MSNWVRFSAKSDFVQCKVPSGMTFWTYMAPTIFAEVKPETSPWRVEAFGPSRRHPF